MGQQRYIQTEAIILKIFKSREIDRNFVFISPTLGVISACAFGAYKIKSRFCTSVQPFVEAKLFLYKQPKSNLFKLEDITNVKLNEFIKKDLNYIYTASFFSECLLNCYLTKEEYKSYYYLILYSLELIEKKSDIKKSILFFLSKLFFLSGYNFYLNGCKVCNIQKENYYFSFEHGGVFCENHKKNYIKKINIKSVKLWASFLNDKYKDLIDIEVDTEDFKNIYKIIIDILYRIFEKKFKTINYINDIFINI